MIIVYFVLLEARKLLETTEVLSKTQKQIEEALTGQRWEILTPTGIKTAVIRSILSLFKSEYL